VKEILDEADVPKGSFYHHFASKEAFAKEVRRYFEELIAVYGPTAEISGCMVGNFSLEMADHSDSIQSLLHQSLSNWQTRSKGPIINIASIVALSPELLNGVYGGTKAFVVNLTQSLHNEVKDKSIHRYRPFSPGPPAPSSGTGLNCPSTIFPQRRSCRPRRWSMHCSQVWTKAS
jgi:hypothetical protein